MIKKGFHRLLNRQLKKSNLTADELGKFQLFLNTISNTYQDFNKDLMFLENILEINSKELYASNQKLEEAFHSKSLEVLETKEQLEKVVHNVKNVIFQVDLEGRFIFLNSAWEDLTGYKVEETIGKSYLDFISYLSEESAERISQLDFTQEAHYIFDFETKTRNHEDKWIHCDVNRIIDANNRITGGIGALVDITTLKNTEKELIKAREQEEKANNAKGEFLSTMSHEIRTPLNTIIGVSNILLMEEFLPNQVENLNALKYSSEYLLILINDILDFNKINDGKIEFEEKDFSMDYLVKSLQKNFNPLSVDKGVKLIIRKGIGIPGALVGDKTRLSQILGNLLGNAIKFTQDGTVELNINQVGETEEKATLYFEVIDTGIGIEQENLDKIFNLFQQAESSTTRKFGGSGLGLAICKKLLNIQNSDLIVDSVIGKGSKFSFTLTFGKSDKFETSTDTVLTDIQSSFEGLGGITVLIVEDFHYNVMILKQFFKMWEVNYDVANNGQEAINFYKEKEYDLILMDLQMPIMDGYEATSAIKVLERSKTKKTPVIALTASAQVEVQNKVMDEGFDAFLSKPFNPINLFNTMKKIVIEYKENPLQN
jgi:PAS domain S-box-containing protein